jgi:hypothetical protein
MATDADVLRLIGRAVPPTGAWRCAYCPTGSWRVVGAWHPDGSSGAYLVMGCHQCGSTMNGGAP